MHLIKPLLGALFAVFLCIAAPAPAITYLYNFDSPTGNLGNTHSYTSNGVSISAAGFSSTGQAMDLYGKNTGGDEQGLGLNATSSDHEITTSTFVQLNLSSLQAKATNPLTLSIGSVQKGEGWNIFQSTSLGAKGTLLASGSTDFPATFKINPSDHYISIQASGGDVLVSTLSATGKSAGVPEPGTMLIVGTGLALAAFRKRSAKLA